MRGIKRTVGLVLIVAGLSGLALTAMVAEDPVDAPEPSDALDPVAPSFDTWAIGLASAGVTVAGIWAHRTARR
jgi:hypothetical protein